MKFSTIGIIHNPQKDETARLVSEIVDICRAAKVKKIIACPETSHFEVEPVSAAEVSKKSDLVISLGGDGTLLSAARECAGQMTPIWGVHIGRLGYLTDVTGVELSKYLPAILKGEYTDKFVELITGVVKRDGEILAEARALNEITVESAGGGNLISLSVEIDGELMSKIDGNGVIVSTPSGSTAYNLAAGGPIVLENADVFIVNPICPHTLTNRPVIVSRNSNVRIRPHDSSGAAQFIADGRVLLPALTIEDEVEIRRSGKKVNLINTAQRNQFEILGEKLGWGNPRKGQGEDQNG